MRACPSPGFTAFTPGLIFYPANPVLVVLKTEPRTMNARQVLCHWLHPPILFFFFLNPSALASQNRWGYRHEYTAAPGFLSTQFYSLSALPLLPIFHCVSNKPMVTEPLPSLTRIPASLLASASPIRASFWTCAVRAFPKECK